MLVRRISALYSSPDISLEGEEAEEGGGWGGRMSSIFVAGGRTDHSEVTLSYRATVY